MNIDKKDILRYLGYGINKPNNAVDEIIDECIHELNENTNLKHIYKEFDLIIGEDNTLKFADFTVKSRNLYRNLQECSKVVLFAATLGVKADFLIKKYSKLQMSKAVIMQACSTAMIEEYCDQCQNEIRISEESKGFYLRPRFSPGYGDFSIEYQRNIISVLETPKNIGVTLMDSLIMAPSKSVTAIIGLSKKQQNCNKKGCEECSKVNCQFRRGV